MRLKTFLLALVVGLAFSCNVELDGSKDKDNNDEQNEDFETAMLSTDGEEEAEESEVSATEESTENTKPEKQHPKLAADFLDKIFALFDANKDEVLTKDEVRAMLTKAKSIFAIFTKKDGLLGSIFGKKKDIDVKKCLDQDGDGNISDAEAADKEAKLDACREDEKQALQAILDCLDIDNDGKISTDETADKEAKIAACQQNEAQ